MAMKAKMAKEAVKVTTETARDLITTMNDARDLAVDVADKMLETCQMGVLLLLGSHLFAWNRAYTHASRMARLLQQVAPELVFFMIFGQMYLDTALVIVCVSIALVMWDIIVVRDVSMLIGKFDGDSSITVLLKQMMRKEVWLLLGLIGGTTWSASYAYVFMLHSSRAPVVRYRQMIRDLFNFYFIACAVCCTYLLSILH